MGGISLWQLLIILLIVVLLFGTKRLKSIGSDLGGAVKGFKKAVTDEEADADFKEGQAKVEEKPAPTATASAKTESAVKEKQ